MLSRLGFSSGTAAAAAKPEDEYDFSASSMPTDGLLEQLNRQLTPLLDAAEALGKDPESSETFPRIVVVGDQSDGKSTVLEAISGVRFPRSSGLCTRCPIQLSLRKSKESKLKASYKINGRQLSKSGTFEDFNRIILEIQEDLTAGLEVPISDELIEVLIQAPTSFDLTLIDLPGINRQDRALENKTIQIIEQFIQCSQTIIIVVFKATTDIQSVKGFQLAKEVDKSGDRTFGVMTFCDGLTDSTEENVGRLLSGQSPEGIVFKDIFPVSCNQYANGGTEAEERELSRREAFRQLPPEKRGTRALATKLSTEVLQRLKTWTKRIVGLVKEKHASCQQLLQSLQRGQSTEEDGSYAVACELLHDLITEISQHITGCHVSHKNEVYYDCDKKFDKYCEELQKITGDCEKQLEASIKAQYSKQRGREFSLAANIFPVMERIVGALISEYEAPTNNMRMAVFQIVQEHMHKVAAEKFSAYPQLRDFVTTKLDEKFADHKVKAVERLDELLRMEKATVFTKSSHFSDNLRWNGRMGSQAAARETLSRSRETVEMQEEQPATDDCAHKSEMDLDEERLLHLTQVYLRVVKHRVVDTVCMTLLNCLNHGLARDLKSFHRVLDERHKVYNLMRDPDREEKLRQARIEAEKWRRQEENLAKLPVNLLGY